MTSHDEYYLLGPNNLQHSIYNRAIQASLWKGQGHRSGRFSLNVPAPWPNWRNATIKSADSQFGSNGTVFASPLEAPREQGTIDEANLKSRCTFCQQRRGRASFTTRPSRPTVVHARGAPDLPTYAARREALNVCGSRSRRIELRGCMMDQIIQQQRTNLSCLELDIGGDRGAGLPYYLTTLLSCYLTILLPYYLTTLLPYYHAGRNISSFMSFWSWVFPRAFGLGCLGNMGCMSSDY